MEHTSLALAPYLGEAANVVWVGVGDDNATPDITRRMPECVKGAKRNVRCACPPNINQSEPVVAMREKGVITAFAAGGYRHDARGQFVHLHRRLRRTSEPAEFGDATAGLSTDELPS